MGTTWLANAHPETFWPHHAWPDFAALAKPKNPAKTRPPAVRPLAVLPLHGFADHGLGLPLDAEEAAGSAILRRAAEIANANASANANATASATVAPLRILPPLRFALAPYPSARFGVDAETAHDQMREIAKSVHASGFSTIIFFNTSPWNEELAATVALDTRAEFALRNVVVNLPKLGLSFHPGAPREARANAQAAAAHALGLPLKHLRAHAHESPKADVRDADFRPGNFQHPEPLAPDESLDGAAIVELAAMNLARTLAGVAHGRAAIQGRQTGWKARPPLPQPFRPHYLPALTAAQLAALPGKHRALVIIPAGAIEQHGPHLPVGVDAMLAEAWLAHTLPKLPPRAARRVFVAPPITFGKSNEHDGFAGTVTISAKTLRRVLLALASELRATGFRNIAVLNTHGGNSPTIVHTLREIQTTLGMRAGMLKPACDTGAAMTPREKTQGIHAGEWETALMLASAPGLVRMDKAVCEYPPRPLDGPGQPVQAWMTRDISKSGVIGDARAATAKNGKAWLKKTSAALAARIVELLK